MINWLAKFRNVILKLDSIRKLFRLTVHRAMKLQEHRVIMARLTWLDKVDPRHAGDIQKVWALDGQHIGWKFESFWQVAHVPLFGKSRQVIVDRYPAVSTKRAVWTQASLRATSECHALVVAPRQVHHIKNGISFCGWASSNYFHWTIECLPKLRRLDALPAACDEWPLLVPSDALQVPAITESLEWLVPDRRLLCYGNDERLLVESNIFLHATSGVTFGLRRNVSPRHSDFDVESCDIEYLRSKLLQHAESPIGIGTRIYLRRSGRRKCINDDQVVSVVREFGFEPVQFEALSLAEQIGLAQSAEYWLGPTDAAWTNLAFAQRAAKALIWVPERLTHAHTFLSIANAVGLECASVPYIEPASDEMIADFLMDVDKIMPWLQGLP